MINTRRRELTKLVDLRYSELFDQGHGPQRHDGDQARDLALEWLTDPSRGRRMQQVGNIEINGEGRFPVKLPIDDVLGSDAALRVEGVARVGSVKNPQDHVDVEKFRAQT